VPPFKSILTIKKPPSNWWLFLLQRQDQYYLISTSLEFRISHLLAGTLEGILAKWATLAPSFLFIFIGAAYVDAVCRNKALSAVLSTVMAAVVGVILNLAVRFALHTLFGEINILRVWGMTLQVQMFSSLIFGLHCYRV